MREQEEVNLSPGETLRFLKSPLEADDDGEDQDSLDFAQADSASRTSSLGELPVFQHHEDASNLELFLDLFFAGNCTVFAQTQSINSPPQFAAYVGYFSVLWMTWLCISMYDVRFVTDSIFERIARAIHLGVLVGFAVVAPKFSPTDQDLETMQIMSVILSVSRWCLAAEYASTLWLVRGFKRAHVPFYVQTGLNIIAAIIYLGVTFAFHRTDHDNLVFLTWCIVPVVEIAVTFLISNYWAVLSFTKTHLMRRLALLTIVILGEGIITTATDVVTIVRAHDSWNPFTVGLVTAATLTIYFAFLIYFDWMKHQHLPAWRQQLWAALHFPYHLTLTLFLQGFVQFVIWSKITDVLEHLSFSSLLPSARELRNATSAEIRQNVINVTRDFFKLYPPTYIGNLETANLAIANITKISDSFWPQLLKWSVTGNAADKPDAQDYQLYLNSFNSIIYSIANGVLESFQIAISEDLGAEGDSVESEIQNGALASILADDAWQRFTLVFATSYIASGAALLIMTVFTILSQVHPWTPWHIIRTVFFILLGIGTGLVSILYYHTNEVNSLLLGPWVLPTLTLVWFTVLVLTHINNLPRIKFPKRAAKHSRQPAKQRSSERASTRAESDLESGLPIPRENQRRQDDVSTTIGLAGIAD